MEDVTTVWMRGNLTVSAGDRITLPTETTANAVVHVSRPPDWRGQVACTEAILA